MLKILLFLEHYYSINFVFLVNLKVECILQLER